ncbi:MAG TPA: enoyl-CoA hydratase [Acidimicrobiales bacterium]
MDLEFVLYDVEDSVGVITLNRPNSANAYGLPVLEELDWAWRQADLDPEVKVIVMRSNGKHFSAGHDMALIDTLTAEEVAKRTDTDQHYDWETRGYFHFAKSWREVPKPSIAAVQGKCIAAGLMLCWPCDLIMAADNAEFSDPVAFMGICGVEMHAHTWEFGARKAKELLFTGGSVTAEEAQTLGMVNHVVPLDELDSATMDLARTIAKQDPFALRMAKRAVNRTLDIQGYSAALEYGFDLHHLGHARARGVTGGKPSLAGLKIMKEKNKAV